MPATWWQLLRAGRQEPEEGEWVTMSAPLTEATYHAGVAITRPRGIVRLGSVVTHGTHLLLEQVEVGVIRPSVSKSTVDSGGMSP
jgi:hypothetical protein